MVAPWPEPAGRRNGEVEAIFDRFVDLVTSLRRLKVEHSVPQSRRAPVTIAADRYTSEMESLREGIVALARLDSVEFVASLPAEREGTARAVTPAGIEMSLDLSELIDVEAERARLARELARLEDEVARSEAKLSNDQFVSKAPSHVVDKEREKLAGARSAREKLQTQLDSVAGE